ncbi:diguanylate cyclase [Nakamurella flavida]|uniref:Diguanylate cyclase n=1 Tax=Nakamurella flavida TaxID=363630 RepID=A0A939C320_9ACTN|nr:diguanylate cyclase [Nakamurella flavida]MBM9476626.1 diguanylate cyclase [Nakamurella flavida]MDP9778936.1 diguanylate cyclase (GGDEF)-like protein [Nakamurella flavida]
MTARRTSPVIGPGLLVEGRRRRDDAETLEDDALVVDDGLIPACGVGSVIFALIAVAMFGFDATPGALPAGVLAVLTCLGMALCWWRLGRYPDGWLRRHSPLVGLVFGMVLCANPLLYMVATRVTWPPIGIILSVIAVGALLPGRFGSLAVVTLAVGGWIACAAAFGVPVPATEFALAVVKTLALAVLLHLAWSRTRRRLHAANRLVTQMAVTDSLTGLVNHRGFQVAGEQAIRRTAARSTAVSVLFVDVDGLKETNDRRGHAAGDEVLRLVARALRESVRDWDVVARLGGDEFAVILEDCSVNELRNVADRLTAAMRAGSVSASVGRATSTAGAGPADFSALVHAADEDMYAHKTARRAAAGRTVDIGTAPSGAAATPPPSPTVSVTAVVAPAVA